MNFHCLIVFKMVWISVEVLASRIWSIALMVFVWFVCGCSISSGLGEQVQPTAQGRFDLVASEPPDGEEEDQQGNPTAWFNTELEVVGKVAEDDEAEEENQWPSEDGEECVSCHVGYDLSLMM